MISARGPVAGARLHRDLFASLRRFHGDAAGPLVSLEERVLRRFERDGAAFSDILEPSISWAPGALSLYRFSYAFPGFRADPAGVARALLDLCAPFGGEAVDHARRLLRAARHPRARQPLFGVALGGAPYTDAPAPDPRPRLKGTANADPRPTLKLYLQFDDAPDRAPLEVAERLLGCALSGRLPDAPLHLLGIDLGPGGVTGAKLYFLHRRLDTAEAAARVGPVELIERLRASGRRALRDVLVIHRLGRPDDPGLERPAEIDLSLPDNGLTWAGVRPLLPAGGLLEGPVAALERAFSLRVRRVSVPVGSEDKLNVYYVLGSPAPGAPAASEGAR